MSAAQSRPCGCVCGCTGLMAGEWTGGVCASCAARDGIALVALNEAPSTGYVWRLGDRPDDVELRSSTYLVADPDRKLVGGIGRHLFALTGPAGYARIVEFTHGRPWRRDALERLTLDVHFEKHGPSDVQRAA